MKIMKKIINVLMIFIIIQLISICFISSKTYATGDSFFEKSFKQGKKFSEMGQSNSENIINSASNVFGSITDVRVAIYYFGVGLIMISGLVMFIKLSMDSNGEKKAAAKITLVVFLIGVLLFVFADKILNGLVSIFEQLEGLM